MVREDSAVLFTFNTPIMTDNDLQLLKLAEGMSYTEWGQVLDFAEKADTDEAKQSLRQIAIRLYHCEEALCGNI